MLIDCQKCHGEQYLHWANSLPLYFQSKWQYNLADSASTSNIQLRIPVSEDAESESPTALKQTVSEFPPTNVKPVQCCTMM